MKAIHIAVACLLVPGVTWAQAKTQDPVSSAASGTDLASEVQALREALAQTQKQVAVQAREIQTLKTQSKSAVLTPATENLPPADNEPGTYDLASPRLGATGAFATASSTEQESTQPEKQGRKSPTGSFQFDNAMLEIGG